MQKRVYPTKSWQDYESELKSIGQRRTKASVPSEFLVALELVNRDNTLTSAGERYFKARFIQSDEPTANSIIQTALYELKPVLAITQNLFGVPSANKDSALSLLHFHGLESGLSDRTLGTLLTLMSKFGMISYYRGSIEVATAPMQLPAVPSSVFISKETPYSNRVWLKRVLSESDDFIYWFDKHFLPAAFEQIWEAADGNRISEIKILSLRLEGNSGRRARKQYNDIATELSARGISLEWRFIDSSDVKATHDRWIIGKSSAWNVPDVGTILSGSHSEISSSAHADEIRALFDEYWVLGTKAFET